MHTYLESIKNEHNRQKIEEIPKSIMSKFWSIIDSALLLYAFLWLAHTLGYNYSIAIHRCWCYQAGLIVWWHPFVHAQVDKYKNIKGSYMPYALRRCTLIVNKKSCRVSTAWWKFRIDTLSMCCHRSL